MKTIPEMLTETKELGILFQKSLSECEGKLKRTPRGKLRLFAEYQLNGCRKAFMTMSRTAQTLQGLNVLVPDVVKSQVKGILGFNEKEAEAISKATLLLANNNARACINHIAMINRALDLEGTQNESEQEKVA